MEKATHALVIGGTGMLQHVCHSLVNDYSYVSVVGRSTIRHQQLKYANPSPDKINSIIVDYHDSSLFREKLQSAFLAYGAPDLVISWIHGTAPQALHTLFNEIQKLAIETKWKLFHVQSSSRYFAKENTPVPDNCQYRRVYLGFILNGRSSRWLTDPEISGGVLHAIKSDQQQTIVGTIDPWDQRPR
ncbi:short-chain dehydrogenase [Virgibacillus phasianinus]|uniref:Short-chain dehydrogenase n=1 Tax=Virgibacillus phasianinus TaxID=2017483 RepID=A0A220U1P0_9BACI|nr:short-chain dehydrogenase [Virgibacillus phasianinus]ASK62000.1 short-chain dehydrogenase [Virgibacillus phasianinus]